MLNESIVTPAEMVENRFIKFARAFRSGLTFWVAPQSIEHLESIRMHELEVVLHLLPATGKILEVGAGTGWQSRALASRGYDVSAIDLRGAKYSDQRVWPITEYDGCNIPFPDATFDIIFSSNVLEHIPHIGDFEHELLRVLKNDGLAVHLLPSGSWRFWTNLTHLLKRCSIPNVHGATAGNAFSEMFHFRRRFWEKHFIKNGWQVDFAGSNGLFYTGHSIADQRLPMSARARLARIAGGSCNVFVLRKSGARPCLERREGKAS